MVWEANREEVKSLLSKYLYHIIFLISLFPTELVCLFRGTNKATTSAIK